MRSSMRTHGAQQHGIRRHGCCSLLNPVTRHSSLVSPATRPCYHHSLLQLRQLLTQQAGHLGGRDVVHLHEDCLTMVNPLIN